MLRMQFNETYLVCFNLCTNSYYCSPVQALLVRKMSDNNETKPNLDNLQADIWYGYRTRQLLILHGN